MGEGRGRGGAAHCGRQLSSGCGRALERVASRRREALRETFGVVRRARRSRGVARGPRALRRETRRWRPQRREPPDFYLDSTDKSCSPFFSCSRPHARRGRGWEHTHTHLACQNMAADNGDHLSMRSSISASVAEARDDESSAEMVELDALRSGRVRLTPQSSLGADFIFYLRNTHVSVHKHTHTHTRVE